MLRKITKVETHSAIVSRGKGCVGGVSYTLTLECGHEVTTRGYAHGSKHSVPVVGRRKQCEACDS